MQLVLLPGMDGTGRLFAPFLSELEHHNSQIISLPDSGPQDYPSLCEWLLPRLPQRPFVLLGESFSGPLAMMLAAGNANIKGLILVATFMQPIRPRLRRLSRYFPMSYFLRSPVLIRLATRYLLGSPNSQSLMLVAGILQGLEPGLIRRRLNSLDGLNQTQWAATSCPVLYLQAEKDSLVPAVAVNEFKFFCPSMQFVSLPANHFVLQALPVQSAAAVANFMRGIEAV